MALPDQLLVAGGGRIAAYVRKAEIWKALRERMAAAQASAAPPPLGFHLLLGADFGQMFRNQVRNLEEGRIAVMKGVWERL